MARTIYSDPFDAETEALKRVASPRFSFAPTIRAVGDMAAVPSSLPDAAKAVEREVFDLSADADTLDLGVWAEHLLGPAGAVSDRQAHLVGAVALKPLSFQTAFAPKTAA